MSVLEILGLVGFAVAWPTGWVLYATQPWKRRRKPPEPKPYVERERHLW